LYDNSNVECNVCREAVSARIDGEREPAPVEQVDRHLAGCPDCARWHVAAIEATRRLRVRTVTATPDLTAAILDRLDAEPPRVATRPRRAWQALRDTLRGAVGLRSRRPATDDPVALPPGARYGRRHDHLRTSHDPAA
jgi:anti-sigma factor RsiW